MQLTTSSLAEYLDQPISILLSDLPFRNWTFERSREDDLDEPLVDYVFHHHGVDVVCDEDETVRTIFLYFDGDRYFSEGLGDLSFSSTRRTVSEAFGKPSRSGDKRRDPVLGALGAWERFDRPEYSVHVEYKLDADRIGTLTLMRADIAP